MNLRVLTFPSTIILLIFYLTDVNRLPSQSTLSPIWVQSDPVCLVIQIITLVKYTWPFIWIFMPNFPNCQLISLLSIRIELTATRSRIVYQTFQHLYLPVMSHAGNYSLPQTFFRIWIIFSRKHLVTFIFFLQLLSIWQFTSLRYTFSRKDPDF